MGKHARREGYWRYYELAKTTEASHLTKTLIDIITENPRPGHKKSKRGRPPVHSKQKLDFACLLMMADNNTYRGIESDLHTINTPWNDEPVPDHTTLARHLQTIPDDWLDDILAETAYRCLDAAGGATGPLAVDSSGVETTRYETVVKQDEEEHAHVEIRQKVYWKYHITAITGLQIVLSALATPGNVHDSVKLPDMLERIRHHEFDFAGRPFNADKGYDADLNFKELFWMGMMPNIKQRSNAVNKNTPNREEAATIFDGDIYKIRALIEGIFGAEETRRHQLHCRFVREDNRRRFGPGRAIAWNIRVLNRFECANKLGIPIPSYGGLAQVECA